MPFFKRSHHGLVLEYSYQNRNETDVNFWRISTTDSLTLGYHRSSVITFINSRFEEATAAGEQAEYAVDEHSEQRRSILTRLRLFIVAGSIALLFDNWRQWDFWEIKQRKRPKRRCMPKEDTLLFSSTKLWCCTLK
jgi:hypothetical protein